MCVFCEIVKGNLPSKAVFENEEVFAFLDIKPTNPGHVLIVPKKHSVNIEETDSNTLADLMSAAKIIGRRLKENLNVPGYNLIINNDPVAGQVIPHLHLHLIPRYPDDGFEVWPGQELSDEEMKKIADSLNHDK
jgi:histidine triad (HIT) family protein